MTETKLVEVVKKYEHRDTGMVSLFYAEQACKDVLEALLESIRGIELCKPSGMCPVPKTAEEIKSDVEHLIQSLMK